MQEPRGQLEPLAAAGRGVLVSRHSGSHWHPGTRQPPCRLLVFFWKAYLPIENTLNGE